MIKMLLYLLFITTFISIYYLQEFINTVNIKRKLIKISKNENFVNSKFQKIKKLEENSIIQKQIVQEFSLISIIIVYLISN